MGSLDVALAAELASLETSGLRRGLRRIGTAPGVELEWQGRCLRNFSSNDYLGLAGHPEVREAAAQGARDWGGGAAASRLICGSLGIHHQLEDELAVFKRAEAVLTFANGYTAALGTIGALVGTGDIVIVDKRVHACVIDGVRLAGATLRAFRHNDLAHLQELLAWTDRSRPGTTAGSGGRPRRVLVVTESVFSMDGDRAALREIVELKDRFGAWLMVDEAHAIGLCGPSGRGLIAEAGLEDRVEVQLGTLGKAIGAAGGYVAGSRTLVDWLVNRARSFIFSTAPAPAAAAAARRGLALSLGAEGDRRRAAVWDGVRLWHSIVEPQASAGGGACASAILPWVVGEERAAVATFERLLAAGFFVPAVRYPTVARGAARLRVTLTAVHGEADVRALAGWLARDQQRRQSTRSGLSGGREPGGAGASAEEASPAGRGGGPGASRAGGGP